MTRPLALLLAACCTHAPRPAQKADPPPADPLPAIRADVEALLRDQAEAYWKAWTTGASVDPAAAWAGRERLLSAETLRHVTESLAGSSGEERRALFHLRAFLVGERLAKASAPAAQALGAARARATFTWEGRLLPLGELGAALSAEPDAARRAALEKAHDSAAARLAPLAHAETQALEAAARGTGAADLLSLAAELRGEPPQALAEGAEALLAATDGVWREVAEDLARRELGIPLSRLRQRDLPRLVRLSHEARAFPAARLLEDGAAALRPLGIDLGGLPGLRIDAGPRPGKDPRPLMLPVEVPGSVRLSVLAGGSAAEARGFLRELGAGVALAHVRSAAVEFRRLGPASWSGAWARLLGALVGHPDWLAERAGLGNHGLGREVRIAWLERLHEVRLAAARVSAEVESARAPAGAAALRARILGRVLGSGADPTEGARALASDPLLQSVEIVRAELLAAQAETFLAARAGGQAWWRSRQNGEWLRRAWAEGSRPTAAELAQALGYPAPEPSALARLARVRLEAAPRP